MSEGTQKKFLDAVNRLAAENFQVVGTFEDRKKIATALLQAILINAETSALDWMETPWWSSKRACAIEQADLLIADLRKSMESRPLTNAEQFRLDQICPKTESQAQEASAMDGDA